MTRGTLYLIDNDACYASFEFNGDMYPEGHGDKVFEGLHLVKNKDEFRNFLKYFNSIRFNPFKDIKEEDWISPHQHCLKHDFTDDYFGYYSSDWIFFKNVSNSPIEFIDRKTKKLYKIYPGESIRFNYGKFHDKKEIPVSVVAIKELSKIKTKSKE